MKFIRMVTALLLLAASVYAYAGKPPPEQRHIYSPPLTGNVFDCWALNTTDADIEYVFIGVVLANGSLAEYETFHWVQPGKTVGTGEIVTNVAHCEIIWEGQRDDLQASFCSYSDTTTHDGRTCIKVE